MPTITDFLAEPIAKRALLACLMIGFANGFVSAEATPHALGLARERATRHWHDRKLWQRIQQNGMRRDFSWEHVAHDYAALYRDAVAARP